VTTTNECSQPLVATFANQSTGAVNYEWDFGDGQTSSLTNPTHTYISTGNYTVSLIASSIYGCKDTAITILNSYPQAVANFSLPNDSICQNESVVFVSTSSFADSLQWNFGDGNLLSGNSVTYAYSQSGVYPVELIAFGQGGCNDTVTLNTQIVIMPTPTADFTFVNIQNTDPLSGTVEFTNLSSGGTSYDWSFGNGNSSTEENPIERYNNFGDFNAQLIVTSDFGCTDTLIQNVNVDFFYGLFIPNAMSPGHSDFGVANFIPKGVGMKNFELLIYDDWGNLIWSTNALDADGRPIEYWDGTFNGEPVQQDAYVWKATATFLNEKVWEGKEYPNGKLKRSGTVTIIR
jgi:PKD repeat protein